MRLITFGCSLSGQGALSINEPEGHKYGGLKYPGLVPSLAEFLDVEYVNYATAAGSNQYSLERFQNYYITDYRPDDIILFQLTSVIRESISIRPINPSKHPESDSMDRHVCLDPNFTITRDDAFLGCSRSNLKHNVHLLSNHPLMKNQQLRTKLDHHGRTNPNELYSRLTSTFHLLHKTHKKFLVWLGWYEALSGYDGVYHEYYEKYLNDNNIPNLLSTPYLDWCTDRNLPLYDDMHPDPETSGRMYAEKVLFPKVKSLL